MEHAKKGELSRYIEKKGRLSEIEACRFFQQIIFGLKYLHKMGFAHRDIKPSNLLLDEYKRIKIVDFGLSNEYKKTVKNILHTSCGSPCYAAPEVIPPNSTLIFF